MPPQEATIDGIAALHENVRVPGSHLGLGFNPIVLWILADRLAQPEGRWRPFEPSGVTGRLYRLLTYRFSPPERRRFARAFAEACRRPRARARYSWKESRTHCAKTSGSGICSRHDVGDTMIFPS